MMTPDRFQDLNAHSGALRAVLNHPVQSRRVVGCLAVYEILADYFNWRVVLASIPGGFRLNVTTSDGREFSISAASAVDCLLDLATEAQLASELRYLTEEETALQMSSAGAGSGTSEDCEDDQEDNQYLPPPSLDIEEGDIDPEDIP